MCDTQIITMKTEDIIKPKKSKKSKKTCAFCKKKLTLVDKSLDKCKGCNKCFCLTCLKPETHACPNKTKTPVVIYKSIVPSKVDFI